MLLESRIVHVPAGREIEADRNEYDGQVGTTTRADFGRAAVEVGTVDQQDSNEDDIVEAIANILHHYDQHQLAQSYGPEWREDRCEDVLLQARRRYAEEIRG